MRTDQPRTVPGHLRSELWSLREDVNLEMEPDEGPVRLRGRWGDIVVQEPSPLVREALGRMRLGPVSLENAISGLAPPAGQPPADGQSAGAPPADAQRTELQLVFDRLQPLIIRSLGLASGQPLLSVVPLTVHSRFVPEPLDPDIPVRLSTFAELRTDGNAYCIESPLALHRVLLHRPEAMLLLGALASPVTPAALVQGRPVIGPVTGDALEYLAAAGMVVQALRGRPGGGNLPVFAEDTDPALVGWSPVDMMFHTRSTLGRHDHNFGITYPTGETAPAEPVAKPQAAHYVQLHRPSWDELCAADPPLTAAIEGRRSMRQPGARPLTVTDLGDLLYRTARVRSLIGIEQAAKTASETGQQAEGRQAEGRPANGYELSDRPYPSGGACYELEFYVTAGDCAGLARGVYHYDPLGHRLEPVGAEPPAVDELLGCARVAAAMAEPPPALISMTVRFRRLSWKYEGLAYRMVLMHVGVLIQSLYLVCTAMRLAPCALGSVSIESAARAFGTDWRVEPCVGQFIVGGEPGGQDRDDSQWRNVNNAEWGDLARAYRK